MTFIPTRRLDDYRNMTFGVSDANHFDNEFMYIKDTNTKQSITIPLPTEITHLLPKNGFLLGKLYSGPVLSNKFSSLMLKIYGKNFGALHLRRMYLTTINNNSPSFLERKNVADAVANSVQESLKYSLEIIYNDT